MGFKAKLYDLLLAPLAGLGALPMRGVRLVSTSSIPLTMNVLKRVGVFPLCSHYYEPLFDASQLRHDDGPRDLPGIDFRIEKQIELLSNFDDIEFLKQVPREQEKKNTFYMNNSGFSSGDAEIWFHVIRRFKPARFIEIGSGNSTLMARMAIQRNMSSDRSYRCEHLCIEPYEMPWLEELGINVLRKKLEDTDPSLMESLQANDILFIDSSHMIRPQGEVLKEYLQILPRLKPGVIVHVHDIFTPRDYPMEWLERPIFWNEQYLLEAFLSHNDAWDVLLAVNMLKHECYDALKSVCPQLDESREPGSFYLQRR
jgi:hypothetical protein